jgi:hypothetical protein
MTVYPTLDQDVALVRAELDDGCVDFVIWECLMQTANASGYVLVVI